MNIFQLKQRLKHHFKKKDEYSIHSPFMFDLYNKTIKKHRNNPTKIILKLKEEYGQENIIQIPCEYNTYQEIQNQTTEETIIIVKKPYKNKDSYKEFKKIITDPRVVVSVDCFKIGLVLQNHKLSPQHYCL